MPDINPSLPQVGQPDSTEEPKVVTALSALIAAVNDVDSAQIQDGAILAADLNSTLAALLGITAGGTTRRGYAEVNTSQSTSSTTFVDLATVGPSVTVTVPTNGLVSVMAAADITPGASQGVVMVQEDGANMTTSTMIAAGTTGTWFTSASSLSGANVKGRGSWLTFPTSAGSHTYKLVYTTIGGTSVSFANRRLWVVTYS